MLDELRKKKEELEAADAKAEKPKANPKLDDIFDRLLKTQPPANPPADDDSVH